MTIVSLVYGTSNLNNGVPNYRFRGMYCYSRTCICYQEPSLMPHDGSPTPAEAFRSGVSKLLLIGARSVASESNSPELFQPPSPAPSRHRISSLSVPKCIFYSTLLYSTLFYSALRVNQPMHRYVRLVSFRAKPACFTADAFRGGGHLIETTVEVQMTARRNLIVVTESCASL